MPRDRRALIGSSIWDEPSVQALTPYQQRAYFLVYTQRDLSRCGVLAYRPRRWAQYAAGDDEHTLRQAFRDLHASRHVVLDEDGDELFVRTYLRHDGLLTQPMVVAGAVRAFETVTSDRTKIGVLTELRRLWDVADLDPAERDGLRLLYGAPHPKPGVAKALGTALADPLAKAIREGYVEPFREGHAEGLPEALAKALGEGHGPPVIVHSHESDDTPGTERETKGHRDPYGEGQREGTGQGTWLRKGTTGVPTPNPDAAARTLAGSGGNDPDDENNDEQTAEAILDTAELLNGVRASLRPIVIEALERHYTPDQIANAVREWASRPEAKPGLLPHLIRDQGPPAGKAPPAQPPKCDRCNPYRRLEDPDTGADLGPCPDCGTGATPECSEPKATTG